jgi:hypothetical protein
MSQQDDGTAQDEEVFHPEGSAEESLRKARVLPVAPIRVNVTCGVHQGHEAGSDSSACLE